MQVRIRVLVSAAAGMALLGLTVSARADYAPGRVPEGANAFTVARHELRLSVLGTSAYGITDHTEISTYLLGDAVLFPNLALEHTFHDDGTLVASWSLGVGAGALPVVAGVAIPLPGGVFGGGTLGVVGASAQDAELELSLRATDMLTLSVGGGAFALEGGFAGLIAGAGAGGGGAGGAGGEVALGGSRAGATAGAEADLTLGRHDVVVAGAEAWFFRPYYQDGPDGLVYAHVAWTHAWTHFHLSLGAYGFVDVPDAKILHDSQMPVAPYANVAWSWQ